MDKRLIGVECFTDRYFFGKLLTNDAVINKLSNNIKVIKKVTSLESFVIGIVDMDKDQFSINPDLKDFEEIYNGEFHKILKHTTKLSFLFIIGPRQLEYFLLEFLNIYSTPITYFGYTSFNEFLKESKHEDTLSYPRLLKLLSFILENHTTKMNHILKIKNQLNYLLDKKFNFNELEFQHV